VRWLAEEAELERAAMRARGDGALAQQVAPPRRGTARGARTARA